MKSNNLELRMYGLVNYQLTGIQKGIQFLHSVVEYGQAAKIKGGKELDKYDRWADEYKTVILLNGGTTSDKVVSKKYFGSINNYEVELTNAGIFNVSFREPDLGDQITSLSFIVDERVFNYKDYPSFGDWVINKYGDLICIDMDINMISKDVLGKMIQNSTYSKDKKVRKEWVDFVGGEKNAFLKEFLLNFKLA